MIAALLIVTALPLVSITLGCRARDHHRPPTEPTASWPEEFNTYVRDEESTYLTFPEWYIVYSAQEYANFLQENRPPSAFPYGAAIGQYWRTYCDVVRVTRSQYPLNVGDHVMLSFIGTSFSVEYAVKGLYEHTVGRLTEWLRGPTLTREDRYAQAVAREYADFLDTVPWYEFPFTEKLAGLWQETGAVGPGRVRTWERKVSLSAEYAVKSAWGWATKKLTKGLFPPAATEITVWSGRMPASLLAAESRIHVIADVDTESQIVKMPRYQAFTEIVPALARQGVRFIQIAGNDDILVTVLAPRQWHFHHASGEELFSMDILTQPRLKRVGLRVFVASLHTVIPYLDREGVNIEHVYDY